MDTSRPAIFVNGKLLPMHIRKRVRTVIQVMGPDHGAVIGKSTNELQIVIKGTPPSTLTNFVEVIGIADNEKSIQAEIWTNFGDTFAIACLDDKVVVPSSHRITGMPAMGMEEV